MDMHYETVEKLVHDKKLSFAGGHRTNAHYMLGHHPERFLHDVQYALASNSWRTGEKPVLSDVYCFECGQTLHYFLRDNQLVPSISSCFQQETITVNIPAPTGELVFTDWPKHGSELLKQLDSMDDDINCLQGRVNRTLAYAEKEMGHFFVGNSSPHVFQKVGNIVVDGDVHEEEEEEEYDNEKGFVCTDLWWVTVFDRQIYENLAKAKFGEEKGQIMTNQMLEEADVIIHVEPGTYEIQAYTRRPYAAIVKK